MNLTIKVHQCTLTDWILQQKHKTPWKGSITHKTRSANHTVAIVFDAATQRLCTVPFLALQPWRPVQNYAKDNRRPHCRTFNLQHRHTRVRGRQHGKHRKRVGFLLSVAYCCCSTHRLKLIMAITSEHACVCVSFLAPANRKSMLSTLYPGGAIHHQPSSQWRASLGVRLGLDQRVTMGLMLLILDG